jgi:hypothetical protein
MKNKLILFLALLLTITTNAQERKQPDPILSAMHSISSHDLLEYVKVQCDEKYAGRLTGTAEYQECAEWLASMFREWGLKPAGENGTWFQWFEIPYTLVHPDCGVSLHLKQGKEGTLLKNYKYVSEYMPGSTSGSGEVTAEVIYAGYGITAPEIGYDDYAGIDVRGKIILIEPESPVSPGEGAEKFNPWFEHSFHQTKLNNAVKHGAVGMLYNYGPIGNPNNAYNKDFIYVHIGSEAVNDIFAGTGKSHEKVISSIKENLKPSSFNTGKTVTIKMTTEHFADGRGSNIIGLLEGTDPVLSKEVIIIGAHLDHLGRCYEIIPGANDNASAVAVMMGVAKALTEHKISLKRSVLFLSFGAEEQGIIGSKVYLDEPVFPLDKSILLNMDGVGIGLSINANAGLNFPEMWKFVEEANEKYIHRVLTTNYFPNLGRPRLDAARFLSAGVPSLSFATYGSRNIYHLPGDNLDIIKPEIMEDMAQLLFMTVVNMGNFEGSLCPAP